MSCDKHARERGFGNHDRTATLPLHSNREWIKKSGMVLAGLSAALGCFCHPRTRMGFSVTSLPESLGIVFTAVCPGFLPPVLPRDFVHLGQIFSGVLFWLLFILFTRQVCGSCSSGQPWVWFTCGSPPAHQECPWGHQAHGRLCADFPAHGAQRAQSTFRSGFSRVQSHAHRLGCY